MIFDLRFLICDFDSSFNGWLAVKRTLMFVIATTICATNLIAADGSIGGTIKSSSTIKSVIAVNRANEQKYSGSVDENTGEFRIAGLPTGATYDCIIDFDGARLEGINLTVPPSDYVEEQPLSKEDIEIITTKVRRMNKFEDIVEIKTIQGNIQHAAILLSKLRTRPFFGSQPGEVIWRAELWHFERPEETWLKVQDELFIVLYRERIQESDYKKKSLTFDASLGGIMLTDDQPKKDLGSVKPPIAKKGIHFRNSETKKSGAGLEPVESNNK